ncbi:MAG: hypothetical protein ACKOJF_02550, partial [Planctomycetaceae bacterium]
MDPKVVPKVGRRVDPSVGPRVVVDLTMVLNSEALLRVPPRVVALTSAVPKAAVRTHAGLRDVAPKDADLRDVDLRDV